MDDKELDQLARDPRYAGKLRKTSKKDKEALKSLFDGIEEEATFKDKRGRPWPKRPVKYAKQLIFKEENSDEEESYPESDSDSDDSSKSDAAEEHLADLLDFDWNSLVEDAKVTNQETRRLAVLHFDWDNANVEAIFIALESFLPAGACLEKVTIYPSELGMRKMKRENEQGPREIWEDESIDNEESSKKDKESKEEMKNKRIEEANPSSLDADEKKAWKLTSIEQRRRLRKYQLMRLKYFYAIAEFDSVETASAVYAACDGVEYGSTGIRFDLRFVDDAETFSVPTEWAHLVSECSEVNKVKYKPRTFETSALHSTRITLGWDRTPAARTEWFREHFEGTLDPKSLLTDRKHELEEYLALSSSGQSTAAPSDVDEPCPAPTVPRIHKHRPPRVAPDALRAALLADVAASTDVLPHPSDEEMRSSSEEEEEEEEDLNRPKQESDDNGDEEYDLTVGADEKLRAVSLKRGRKSVTRKRLPEAVSSDSDADLDFADMEDRVSDEELSNEEGDGGRKKRKPRKKSKSEIAEAKATAKKKRLTQRKKMLLKKKKQENNQEKLKDLWTGENENDHRFDIYLTDPAFGVSQLNPGYKNATEFLNFMRRRRKPEMTTK